MVSEGGAALFSNPAFFFSAKKSCFSSPRLDVMAKQGTLSRSGFTKKPNEMIRLVITATLGVLLGFLMGVSCPTMIVTMLQLPSSIITKIDHKNSGMANQEDAGKPANSLDSSRNNMKIYVPTNPKGAESLPPNIVESESDFYIRRLWGNPNEDITIHQKYLVAFTIGYKQKDNIDAAIKKFSENFTIVLFHYDGYVNQWDEFEWSKRAIHVSVRKQTKWWYAKRFLHPDIVAPYEYIFIWDEDLGVEHFNAEEYIKLVKKHGLEISQPGLDPNKAFIWRMTRRQNDSEVHRQTKERSGWCHDPQMPPCAAFVEIMAPVFSRDAWRCVWHMIQNDLVHGWGLDFALRRCVEPANEKIGVVDAQWIVHRSLPSLGNEGEKQNGRASWEGVRQRCRKEWGMFQTRMADAEKTYFKKMGLKYTNDTKR